MNGRLLKFLDEAGQCFEHPAFAMGVRCFLAFAGYVLTCELIKMRSNDPQFVISWFNIELIILGGLYQVAVVINANMSGSWARYFEQKRNGGSKPEAKP